MHKEILDAPRPSPGHGDRWPFTLALWLCAAVAIVPFLLRGPSCGADFLFHFASWHDALNSWRHHLAYPHWTASANFGAGEPRFVFYPPLTWMLGALLGWLLPWPAVPVAMNFLFLALTGLATRALARRFLPELPATLAGAAAIFSGYCLYEAYFHSDFALLTGGFWVPLLLLFFFDLATTSARTATTPSLLGRATFALALIVAGSWLSNAPLGLMVSYVAATLALVAALQLRSWRPLVRTAIPLALGLGLTGFYLVPAAREQRWIDIKKLFLAPEHLIQNRWITFELMGPPHGLYPSQRFRGIIEVVTLLMALGGIAVVVWRGRWPPKRAAEDRQRWFQLAVIPSSILVLMFPISLPLWNLLPRLRYLEYPWRWMVVLGAPASIFFVAAIWPRRPRLRPYFVAAAVVVFLFTELGASTNRHLFHACSASPTNPLSIAAMDTALRPGGLGVGGTDEYSTPPGAEDDLIATHLPDACLVRDPSEVLSHVVSPKVSAFYTPRVWSPALGTCDATYTAVSRAPESLHLIANVPHSGYLILKLRSYPAWAIVQNGTRLAHLPFRADGLIAVPVAAGPVDLTASWTETPDVLFGRGLTALSALLLLGLGWLVYRRPLPAAPAK